jgi:hypothetical protein
MRFVNLLAVCLFVGWLLVSLLAPGLGFDYLYACMRKLQYGD